MQQINQICAPSLAFGSFYNFMNTQNEILWKKLFRLN